MNTSSNHLVLMVLTPVLVLGGMASTAAGAAASAPAGTRAPLMAVNASGVTATGPVWPIGPRTIPATGSRQKVPVLTAIRTGRHGSYERLVLQFSAPFGQANVRYVPVVRADPSNKVVPLKGQSFLQVVVHGAVARWSSTPIRPYAGPSTVTPGYPTLKQASISGDFEAVLSLGLGLSRTAGFQVTRLRSPDRLVVDVAESPAWRMWPDGSLATAKAAQAAFNQGHMSWRGSGASVAWSYALAVYGWNSPVVTRVPGTDTYRLSHQGSPDRVTVRAVRAFPTTSRHSIYEITNTR